MTVFELRDALNAYDSNREVIVDGKAIAEIFDDDGTEPVKIVSTDMNSGRILSNPSPRLTSFPSFSEPTQTTFSQ